MNTMTAEKSRSTRPHNNKKVRVRLEFTDSAAESVCIAGTFNDWRPEVTRMIHLGAGRWAKDLSLPPGDYEYCLVVDGYKWVPDPRASETAPNPFGGLNSVLKVTPPN